MSDSTGNSSDQDYERHQQLILQCTTVVTYAAGAVAVYYGYPLYNKTPYHTSALTGADWVCELLDGHPEHIRNELGVHKEVFHGLIEALREGGLRSS